MHKAKPTKGILKRFRISGKGKLVASRPGRRKFMSHKGGRHVMRLRRKEVLGGGLALRILRAIRYI